MINYIWLWNTWTANRPCSTLTPTTSYFDLKFRRPGYHRSSITNSHIVGPPHPRFALLGRCGAPCEDHVDTRLETRDVLASHAYWLWRWWHSGMRLVRRRTSVSQSRRLPTRGPLHLYRCWSLHHHCREPCRTDTNELHCAHWRYAIF